MLLGKHGDACYNLGSYGYLHCGPLPPQSLTMLRAHSSTTPPDACAHVNDVFDARTMMTLCQAHGDEYPLHCVKLVDGFVIVTPSNKIVSVISDNSIQLLRAPAVHVTAPHHEKTRRAQHQTPITQQHNVVSWRYIYLFIVYALTHFRNECCKAFMSHHRCRKTFSSVQPHAAPSSASDANC